MDFFVCLLHLNFQPMHEKWLWTSYMLNYTLQHREVIKSAEGDCWFMSKDWKWHVFIHRSQCRFIDFWLKGMCCMQALCEAMTYTMMDGQGRHASEKTDADVVQADSSLRFQLSFFHIIFFLEGNWIKGMGLKFPKSQQATKSITGTKYLTAITSVLETLYIVTI